MNRKRSLMERLGLAIGYGESDPEPVTDDQPAGDPWFDDEDEPDADPWLDAESDVEPAADDAAPDQATDTDPDVAVDVADNQLTDPQGDQSVGDAPAEVAPAEQQSEAAPSDQPEAASQPPQIDPIGQLLAGDDAELEAAIQQAQAEADAAAEELEQFNQRVAELQAAHERIGERIRELKVQRAELVPEALLRNNKRARERLAKLGADLRELQTLHEDHKLALEAAAIESVRLLATLDQRNRHQRRLQAQLASRKVVRLAQATDRAIAGFLDALAAMRQAVEELIPLLDEPSRRYLDQFRTDLPVRLALHHYGRAVGMAGVLDLPPFEPRVARSLAVQIGELLANLLKPTTDNSEVPNAELQRTYAPGSAAAQ